MPTPPPYSARTAPLRRSPRPPASSPSPVRGMATRRSPTTTSVSTPPARRSPRLRQASTLVGVSTPAPRPTTSTLVPRTTPPAGTRRSPRLTPPSPMASMAVERPIRRAHVSLSPQHSSLPVQPSQPVGNNDSNPVMEQRTSAEADARRNQLVVRPIIKSTIGQRDTSGDTLDDVALNGKSFMDILHKIWAHVSSRIKGRAVKTDGVWSVAVPDFGDWSKFIQLKSDRHIVDNTKTQQQWNAWLVAVRGKTVKLLVYEYGVAITKASDLEAFKATCVLPSETNRAGATAEVCFQQIVDRLHQRWDSTFQATTVVWRMWANHLTRNLDRSTWETAIMQDPPTFIVPLLRPTDTQREQQLSTITQSAHVAMTCVDGFTADIQQVRRDWKALGLRLESCEKNLATQKAVVEAFIRNSLPSEDVIDPLLRLENINDIDHE